jgi:SAM-dependent methyltransferase
VDALPDAPGVDVVADISQRLPFEDGSADLIYASHLLEHFSHDETLTLLTDWRRVLRPGGQLMVAVPDLDVIARMLVERSGWFTPPNQPWVGAIFGGQKDEFDFHKTGFTAPWLASLMAQADFGDIRQVDRFSGIERDDTSYSPAPFGVNVSLNMIATSGAGTSSLEGLLQPAPFESWFYRFDQLLQHALNLSSRVRARLMQRRRRRIERTIGAQTPR